MLLYNKSAVIYVIITNKIFFTAPYVAFTEKFLFESSANVAGRICCIYNL